MSSIIRHLLFAIIFLAVISIERTLGLPFISLVFASNYLAPVERVGKSIGIIFAGILLGISYLTSIWLGIAVVAALVFVLEHRLIFFHRETLTYFASVTLAAILIAMFSHYPISFGNVLYHFVLAIMCLFAIRFWLMKKTAKWKTS